jgi:hypothetical protein
MRPANYKGLLEREQTPGYLVKVFSQPHKIGSISFQTVSNTSDASIMKSRDHGYRNTNVPKEPSCL